MKITAKVVADSICGASRLTTMQLEYPRFIHGEFMTHRVFSRNAASSRAIPVKKMVGMALDDPAFFVHIGSNRPGMQAGEEVGAQTRIDFETEWRELSHIVSQYAMRWSDKYGIHKQVVNRVMEPWYHIKVVVTATDWQNFYDLRDHADAQPEIRALAQAMRKAQAESEPVALKYGAWHLPYITEQEEQAEPIETLVKASAARCARVSYMNHDGTSPDIRKDIELHDMLVGGTPIHASPMEHQAMAIPYDVPHYQHWMRSNLSSSFLQYRKIVEEQRYEPRNSLSLLIARGPEWSDRV